ncbi:transmembrane protein, putative (macronuclear) [Tetrahymena thermophila SB210]|uniref:Transmembrane protein, putative n=1 Tax=Tetrahymena thermophila (strain SB210) TaxID=312017 RepID=W7X3M4_TETTS|nr:transmembrane protein, putative [Tetrahymena thermophila SB210]EWS73905.1 transmembrane protein, putative [Tetrahymena thermophila SB210]|eukprot:XP_012653560.1 transmembrane protein, putative [Tetrahymena thermophila SB210]
MKLITVLYLNQQFFLKHLFYIIIQFIKRFFVYKKYKILLYFLYLIRQLLVNQFYNIFYLQITYQQIKCYQKIKQKLFFRIFRIKIENKSLITNQLNFLNFQFKFYKLILSYNINSIYNRQKFQLRIIIYIDLSIKQIIIQLQFHANFLLKYLIEFFFNLSNPQNLKQKVKLDFSLMFYLNHGIQLINHDKQKQDRNMIDGQYLRLKYKWHIKVQHLYNLITCNITLKISNYLIVFGETRGFAQEDLIYLIIYHLKRKTTNLFDLRHLLITLNSYDLLYELQNFKINLSKFQINIKIEQTFKLKIILQINKQNNISAIKNIKNQNKQNLSNKFKELFCFIFNLIANCQI